jgi:hypothetical protein
MADDEGVPTDEDEAESFDWVTGLSTGFESTDRWLGGLTPGSLVALVGDPDSPSEELLYPMADANPTRYLSLLRSAAAVERHAESAGFDDFEVSETTSASLLDDPAGALSGLEPESLVVVDPATELEREGRERYLAFLETLDRAVSTTESVAVLHCPRMNPRALQRDLTLVRADTVLELLVQRGSGDALGPRTRWFLTAEKRRLGRLPDDGQRFAFGHDGPEPIDTRELS